MIYSTACELVITGGKGFTLIDVIVLQGKYTLLFCVSLTYQCIISNQHLEGISLYCISFANYAHNCKKKKTV